MGGAGLHLRQCLYGSAFGIARCRVSWAVGTFSIFLGVVVLIPCHFSSAAGLGAPRMQLACSASLWNVPTDNGMQSAKLHKALD